MAFRRGDIADLAQKLQIICNDAELVADYKQKAADYICQRYNWEDVVSKTLDVYRG